MLSRIWLKLGEILVPTLLAITVFVAWQADRRDRAQLAAQLATAQKTIAEATANQHERDATLNQTLAQLASQKLSAVTPGQILRALPNALSLPAPITLQASTSQSQSSNPAGHQGHNPGGTALSDTVKGSETVPSQQVTGVTQPAAPQTAGPMDAILPSADLKPLYDFALDCKACQAKLSASQSDLVDEKTKTAALTKERDAAIRAAKGGSALRRITRAAKWFALGAAAGAIAAKATR